MPLAWFSETLMKGVDLPGKARPSRPPPVPEEKTKKKRYNGRVKALITIKSKDFKRRGTKKIELHALLPIIIGVQKIKISQLQNSINGASCMSVLVTKYVH